MTISWHEVFGLSVSPVELVVRGTLVYLFLFAVFRTVLQRDIGAVGMADVLLLVLVADAAQNAMAAEYKSVTDGIVLVSTILGWNLLVDYLCYRYPRVRRLLQSRELCLVRNGRILRRNLRRELLSVDELRAKLREHGISDLAEVREAYMESDGSVSVIRRDAGGGSEDPAPSRRPTP